MRSVNGFRERIARIALTSPRIGPWNLLNPCPESVDSPDSSSPSRPILSIL